MVPQPVGMITQVRGMPPKSNRSWWCLQGQNHDPYVTLAAWSVEVTAGAITEHKKGAIEPAFDPSQIERQCGPCSQHAVGAECSTFCACPVFCGLSDEIWLQRRRNRTSTR